MDKWLYQYWETSFETSESSISFLLEEIKIFNDEFWFVKTYQDVVNRRISKTLKAYKWNIDMYDQVRKTLSESIKNCESLCQKIWCEIFSYRSSEFYRRGKQNAIWNKFWIGISDNEKFQNYFKDLSEEDQQKLLDFFYQEIIDGLLPVYFDNEKSEIGFQEDVYNLLIQLNELTPMNHLGLIQLIQALESFYLFQEYWLQKYVIDSVDKSDFYDKEKYRDCMLRFHNAMKVIVDSSIHDNIELTQRITKAAQHLNVLVRKAIMSMDSKEFLDDNNNFQFEKQHKDNLENFYKDLEKYKQILWKIMND